MEGIPYDRVIRPIDAAVEHPDKLHMKAIYGNYLDELHALIKMCQQKGLLKEDPE